MKTKVLAVGLVLFLLIGVFLFALMRTDELPSSRSVLDAAKAIDVVIAEYPELEAYKTTSLPPSSIESKETVGGWYVGFIREGSGIRGVLDAKCYFVGDDASVIPLGQYVRGEAEATDINIETCKPVLGGPDTTTSSPGGVGGSEPDDVLIDPPVPDYAPIPDEPRPAPISSGGCYRGGCSGQICSDRLDAVSTCEYRPEYACYQSATCERQSNGNCGWTQDSALRACLMGGGESS